MEIGQQPMMQSQEIRIEPSTILSIKISLFGLDLMLSNNLDNSMHVSIPLTLLPCLSNLGDTTPIASLPGTTAIMPPPTPLLPGNPILQIQGPE